MTGLVAFIAGQNGRCHNVVLLTFNPEKISARFGPQWSCRQILNLNVRSDANYGDKPGASAAD